MSLHKISKPLFELSVEKMDTDTMKSEWIVLHRGVADEPTTCPCGKQGIRELCYIRNRHSGLTIFVGNCCVRFLGGHARCADCEIYTTVSPTAHLCRFCAHRRKDAPTGFVTKGKPLYGTPILGKTYKEAYLANTSYARYILATPSTHKYNDPHYIEWLRLNESRNLSRSKYSVTQSVTVVK
jgi:hypothetical protein